MIRKILESVLGDTSTESVVNEDSLSEISKYAKIKGKEATDKLRELVIGKFDLKNPPPKLSAKNIPDFVKGYNKLLKKYPSEMKTLFDIVPKGTGRAEVMLAFIHDELSIGGGSQNYDVDFFNEKIEVKEVVLSRPRGSKAVYGGNFRLGVDSTHLLKRAYEELVELYSVARHYIPSIDNDSFAENVYKKGGIALGELRNWKIPDNLEVEEIDLNIKKSGYITHNSEIIGNLKDKGILRSILSLFNSPKKVKSFGEIERTLEAGLAAHDMQYFFFGNLKSGIPLYYKKRIDSIRIEAATGHKVKFQVKLA